MKRWGLVLGATLMATRAFGWGATGHEMINELTVRYLGNQAPPFLADNVKVLEQMATVPDRTWKSGGTRTAEGPLHFFQWDIYQETDLSAVLPLAYSEATHVIASGVLDENGKAIWRAGALYTDLTKAVASGNCNQILQVAGTLGHYFADLAQPMHVTADYDGQSIGKPGIHSHFETKMVQSIDRNSLSNMVINEAKTITNLKLKGKTELDVIGLAFAEAKISLQNLPRLINIYRQGSVGNTAQVTALQKEIPPAMARGVYALAQVWQAAFANKDSQLAACEGTRVNVPDPAWIAFPE